MSKKHNELFHYGTPRHSGRYPWGSGENPYQHEKGFNGYVNDLKKQGLTEKQIADGLGMSTTQLRAKVSIAKSEQQKADIALALKLKQKGMSNVAIGKQMGINESQVRSLIKQSQENKVEKTFATANALESRVKDATYIDIGPGSEHQLGISRTRLNTAVAMLEEKGYTTHNIQVEQVGNPGKYTTVKVLAAPGQTLSDVYKNMDKIKLVQKYTEDGGKTFLNIEDPVSVSSKRIQVRYAEDGGKDRDGLIELRRNVDDLSLGNAKYAQVRIAVDDSHYLKGMAMYSDDLPPGVDIRFNTNKSKNVPVLGEKDNSVLKPLKADKDNPFGATVRQRHYVDKDGKTKLSAINIVNEEGDWSNWSKNIASQMLSKQSPTIAKKQLDLSYAIKKEEYDEIMSLTNPAVKKKLLESFADGCDSDSVHLKAAAFPRQSSNVILPFPGIKENEIFAPNYRNGEQVVLIRYPHGGTFEIPTLRVNNKYPEANKVIRNAVDAVGINPKAAQKLSGADFDGDTVLVIPTSKVKITTSVLKDLEGFDPQESYPAYEGMPKMKSQTKQTEMGKISNLITDMTIKGAKEEELARAVKHSMVVIDAEKHNLNYKKSYVDNGIEELKKKYQVGGASTLISRAKSEVRVNERKEGQWVTDKNGNTKKLYVDPETGKKLYSDTGATYMKKITKKDGSVTYKEMKRQTKTTQMAETDDAFNLSSGTRIENVYANHANKLKMLANTSRKEALAIKPTLYSPSAKKVYEKEVKSLDAKLVLAQRNKPYERQAQILANKIVEMKTKDNPDMEKDQKKRLKGQALSAARQRVGAKRSTIEITDREWEAIQAGAVSYNKQVQIFDNTDLDSLKQRATPRQTVAMPPAKISRARAMMSAGYTQAEIADVLGVSTTTVSKYINS